MAQTDARAGFRLPWSSERSNIEQAETDQVGGASDVADGWPTTDAAPETGGQAPVEQADSGWGTTGATSDWGSPATDPAPAQAPTPSPSPSVIFITRV